MTDQSKREVHAEHRMCRVFQHAWEPTTVKREGGVYLQGLRCMRCSTERLVRVDPRTGELKGARYNYAEGYLLHGGGGLTSQERAELRLAEVAGHLPKRRRKK
ncbi:hypothetical protein SEA_STROSAHL_35 [Gordonia phage Strosahl]|uniref:Uncharacterized protein n=5 Tax=Soupsvirus TaxID=1982562 RepID=A0A160DGM0_9CAUD|nr:hypothetical protein BEN61_gp076 [Gordonia phage Rosalind]YP_009269055.1 hypothetical protein BEN62_gp075 [Gordonia phage KatherineG]YP_009269333.1 hypothetical protein BEN59_gp076 [Gordonia phage Soups]YP_009281646.1 hypothetical protein BIZ67_gp075 [Gordonia phage Remus]YP_009285976.1 hypothetical protein BIZ70_gp078 [Gordonia phage JSwag]YP_009596236.1 hypothetical protein FDH03_gp075 [Gordonia phage Strosahl]YP_009624550.1 hypothetical protein FDJ48_gp075 [Gordonia phage Waits]ASZ7391